MSSSSAAQIPAMTPPDLYWLSVLLRAAWMARRGAG
jgi:hypothetical protein